MPAERAGSQTVRFREWKDRIAFDANVCHGKSCIKGTRIIVSALLDYLSAGESEEEILHQYPVLKREDLLAALGYATWLAHEEEELPLHTRRVR